MGESTTPQTPVAPLLSMALGGADAGEISTERALLEALHAIRAHLGMEVAFISEFDEDRRVFRYVDEDEGAPRLEVGASGPRESSYCQRVVDGRLPELIPDACQDAEALELPVTRESRSVLISACPFASRMAASMAPYAALTARPITLSTSVIWG